MKGTEKQIAWAEDIKAAFKANAELVKTYPGMSQMNIEYINRVEAYMDSLESAGEVIDNFQMVRKADNAVSAFKNIGNIAHYSEAVKKIAMSMRGTK